MTVLDATASESVASLERLRRELDRERSRLTSLRRDNAALRDAIVRAPAASGKARSIAQLATAAYTGRNFDKAVELLEAAVLVEPDNNRLWLALARARRMAGDLSGARAAASRSLTRGRRTGLRSVRSQRSRLAYATSRL